MNTLGRCPHCGAPVKTDIKIENRFAICEYCASEFILDGAVYTALVERRKVERLKQEQKARWESQSKYEAAKAQRIKEETEAYRYRLELEDKMKKEKEQMEKEKSIAIRRVIAIVLTVMGLGMFGGPSLVCKQYKLFALNWGIIVFFALVMPTAGVGFAIILCEIVIPIISIKYIK